MELKNTNKYKRYNEINIKIERSGGMQEQKEITIQDIIAKEKTC